MIERRRREYVVALTDRLDRIETCLRADASCWPEARSLVHRIVGTAGSFGLTDLTEHARRLETQLTTARSVEDVAASLAALRRAVAHQQQTDGAHDP